MNRIKSSAIAVLIAGLLFALLIVPVSAQGRQVIKNLLVNYLDVTTELRSEGTTILGGALTGTTANFTGNVSTDGNMTTYGAEYVGTFLTLGQAATVVLTATDATLTPIGTYQPISSSAAIGTASIASKPAGTLLRIVNIGSQTITFTDTGTLRLSSDIALGQYDSLLLMSAGTGQGWIQMGTSNN